MIIIDPYIESNIFQYLKFINKNIFCALIYSKKAKISSVEINGFIKEGFKLKTIISDTYHDRFIIVDGKTVYHIGTSLNYLGSKTFLINKIDDESWIKKFIKSIKI